MMTIGQRIKSRRKELHISAEELADKLHKNRSTIYRYEKGDIENLPLEILEPIAKALDTTPIFLMGWDNEQIEANSKIIEEKNEYLDKKEIELKAFIDSLIELDLDSEKLEELYQYAVFKKSMKK